jgi:hypothetical protein
MASRAGAPGSRSSASSSGHSSSVTARSTTDPILRNALRYTISTREYATLHKYVISRSRALKKHAPAVGTVQRIIEGPGPRAGRTQPAATNRGGQGTGTGKEGDREDERATAVRVAKEYNARAVRHSIRVFVATGVLMKLWELVSTRVLGKKEYVLPSLFNS